MANNNDHDVFACDCHETCSLCAEPFRLTQLKRLTIREGGQIVDVWENVCPNCRAQ